MELPNSAFVSAGALHECLGALVLRRAFWVGDHAAGSGSPCRGGWAVSGLGKLLREHSD